MTRPAARWAPRARKLRNLIIAAVVRRRKGSDPRHSLSLYRGGFRDDLAHRLGQVLEAAGEPAGPVDLVTRTTSLAELLDAGRDRALAWLTLSVIHGALPTDDEVVHFVRRLELDGVDGLILEFAATLPQETGHRDRPPAEVVTDRVLVDLHHTSQTDLATGIQRVARETSALWDRDDDILVVGWNRDLTALEELTPGARRRALGLGDEIEAVGGTSSSGGRVLVPWRSTYLLPELMTETPRTARLLALARHSPNRTGLIGFDCVPLTTAETTAAAMGAAFARLMAAARHMDVVAAISHASAEEHRGWAEMLGSAGLAGPEIAAITLPVSRHVPSPEVIEEARRRFAVGRLPIVLCVGSHEPRKNHLAVLHAAEQLWRRGRRFSLLFIGGNAWRSEPFTARLDQLRSAGRPVDAASGVDDDLLWAAYALAHVVVFPSLNEGFGLPVAEALASGTPVITSNFGSMAEIAAGGGAVLVDPRDDSDLTSAIENVLLDDDLHAQLADEAAQLPTRSWDDYAAETWACLVHGATDGEGRTT